MAGTEHGAFAALLTGLVCVPKAGNILGDRRFQRGSKTMGSSDTANLVGGKSGGMREVLVPDQAGEVVIGAASRPRIILVAGAGSATGQDNAAGAPRIGVFTQRRQQRCDEPGHSSDGGRKSSTSAPLPPIDRQV
nr:hypothetical protein [uncultured Lichenicoccus sp.]